MFQFFSGSAETN